MKKILLIGVLSLGILFASHHTFGAENKMQPRPLDVLKTELNSGGIFEKANSQNTNCRLAPDLKSKISKPGEGDKLTAAEKKALQAHFECRRARLLSKLCYLGLSDFPAALGAEFFSVLETLKSISPEVDGFADGSKLKQKYQDLDKRFDQVRSSIGKIAGASQMDRGEWDEAVAPQNDAGKCGLLKDQVVMVGGARCRYNPQVKDSSGNNIPQLGGAYLVFTKVPSATLSETNCGATRTDGTTESTLKSCQTSTLCEGYSAEENPLACEWVRNDVVGCNEKGVTCQKATDPQIPENPTYVCQKGSACMRFQMGTWQSGCPSPNPSPSNAEGVTDPLNGQQKMRRQIFNPPGAAAGAK